MKSEPRIQSPVVRQWIINAVMVLILLLSVLAAWGFVERYGGQQRIPAESTPPDPDATGESSFRQAP